MPSRIPLTTIKFFALCLLCPAIEQAVFAEPAEQPARSPRVLPGWQTGGNVLLPTQWSLRPAGSLLVRYIPKCNRAGTVVSGNGDLFAVA